MKESKVKKDIVLAFFDILGTSKKIENENYDEVYEFYTYMSELCSEEEIVMSFSGLSGYRNKNEDFLLSCPLKHVFFSDSFIIWIEDIRYLGMNSGGFLKKCMDIFVEAVKRGIPLRGAISRGTAIMDEDNNLYLGKPIVEAVRAEGTQNWIGITLAQSWREISTSDAWLLLPYAAHIKEKVREELKEGQVCWVLDWPKYWRETKKEEVVSSIEKMNNDEKFSSYYENAIKFVKYSEENGDFWKDKIPEPPIVKPVIVLTKE